MYIRLKVQKLSVSDSYNLAAGVISRRLNVIVDASYEYDSGYIKLDTGEVFTNPERLRLGFAGASKIQFSLQVLPNLTKDELRESEISYLEGRGNVTSLIAAAFFIPQDQFAALLSNLRSGMYPSHIIIEIERNFFRNDEQGEPPIEFGWEPDGSGLIWHNKQSPRLPLHGIEFKYPLLDSRPSNLAIDEAKDADAVPVNPGSRQTVDPEENKRQIANIQIEINRVRRAVYLVAALVAAIAIMQAFGSQSL